MRIAEPRVAPRVVALAVVVACALFVMPISGSASTEENGCDSVPPSRQVMVYSGFEVVGEWANLHSYCRSEMAVLTPGADSIRIRLMTLHPDDLPYAVVHGLGFDGLSTPIVEGGTWFGYWSHRSAVLQIPDGPLASGCLRVELISQEHPALSVQYRTAGVLACT